MNLISHIRESLALTLFLLITSSILHGQEVRQEHDIFDHLATQTSGGLVIITQPDWLRDLVGKKPYTRGSIISGFRIQVYTSNMKGAKQEAYNLANQFKALATDLPCYVTYQAPFWRLSIGDYLSQQEAQEQLKALRSSHPNLMREAYIVREKVQVH